MYSSKGFKIGTSTRNMYNDKHAHAIPAPGHYTIAKGSLEKKGVRIGEKLNAL